MRRSLLGTVSKTKGDLIVFVSDYEAWAERYAHYGWGNRGTGMMQEWNAFKACNPQSKLACINLVANSGYHQVADKNEPDILKIAGFSDQVWNVISEFAQGHTGPEYWVQAIESINLDEVQETHQA